MLVFLLMLQYAVKAHAHRVAEAAAEEALAAASAYDGSRRLRRAGRQSHAQRPRQPVEHNRCRDPHAGRRPRSTVTGDVEQLIPFVPVHVTVHIEGPVEQFVESP